MRWLLWCFCLLAESYETIKQYHYHESMEGRVRGQHYETPYFPHRQWHPPSGMALPRTAWVRLNRLRSPHRCPTFPLLLVQMGYGPFCGLIVWRRRTNRRPCCPPMSNPSTSPWTARPDSSRWWDNRMATQHLPRDLVPPSNEGLTQTMKKKAWIVSYPSERSPDA